MSNEYIQNIDSGLIIPKNTIIKPTMDDINRVNNDDIAKKAASLYGHHFSPVTLMSFLNPKFETTPVHRYIGLKIRECVLKDGGQLIISLPPRIGKSEEGSFATPVWFLDCFPNLMIILACADAGLAKKFGRRIRDTFQVYGNTGQGLLRNNLKSNSKSASEFHIETTDTFNEGGMLCIGVDSAVIGRGGDLMVLDDYIKNAEAALKPGIHDKNWDWWNLTYSHRVQNPKASKIIIATRWHDEDIIGRIKDTEADEWDIIELPAECVLPHGEVDEIGRKRGELIYPTKFDHAFYQKKKRQMGVFYDAVYQQSPRKIGDQGRTESDIPVIELADLPDVAEMRFCRAWDLGGSNSLRSDPSVGILFGWHQPTSRFYILHVWRRRKNPGDLIKSMKLIAIDDRQRTGGRYKIYFEEEGGSSGKIVTDYFKNMFKAFSIEGVASGGKSKEQRLIGFFAAVDAGNVFMLNSGTNGITGDNWNVEFITEYVKFPSYRHDDQMDCCSLGYNQLEKNKSLTASWGYGNIDSNELNSTSASFGDENTGDIMTIHEDRLYH